MSTDQGTKKTADWESIEKDFRAGVLSIREIAKLHGLTDTAIRKKAKASGWERDLTEKVAAKVRTELVRTQVRTPHAGEQLRTEREIVESAAATVVQVVREHRKDISTQRGIVALLASQLVDAASNRRDIEDDIDAECASDRSGERKARMMRAVALPMHAVVVRDLSNAMKNLIGLERQAFSIGDAQSDAPDEQVSAISVVLDFDSINKKRETLSKSG